MGRFVTGPCGADARQFHVKSAAAGRVPEGRRGPEKGTGANYSARGAAPICGKEAGVMANSIIRSGEESDERATWCKNARNCWFSHYDPVTR